MQDFCNNIFTTDLQYESVRQHIISTCMTEAYRFQDIMADGEIGSNCDFEIVPLPYVRYDEEACF